MSKDTRETFLENWRKEFKFHCFWQNTTMWLYVISTVVTIVASTGASITAALGQTVTASFLAGLATVLIGIEKTLLFREKWKLHLHVVTQLKKLNYKFSLDLIDDKDACKDLTEIIIRYSDELPFAEREKKL